MSAKRLSPEDNPSNSRIGELVQIIDEDKGKLQAVYNKLRDRSKEFLQLSKDVNPDTGGFSKETTDTVFVKRIKEKTQTRRKQFTIPVDTGDLIFQAAQLEKAIQENEKEIQSLKA